LKSLSFKSFYQKLEHLDLSFNCIQYLEANLFANYIFNVKASLIYLNLENNQIISFENVFTNYINLKVFKIGHNRITTIPEFSMHWSGQYEITASYFYFNYNNLSRIRFFSHYVHEMVVLNLDYNLIDTIDDDALFEVS